MAFHYPNAVPLRRSWRRGAHRPCPSPFLPLLPQLTFSTCRTRRTRWFISRSPHATSTRRAVSASASPNNAPSSPPEPYAQQPTVAVPSPSSSLRTPANSNDNFAHSQAPEDLASPQLPPAGEPQDSASDVPSSALERGDADERYIDLRTLKKLSWSEHVRNASSPAPGCRFGPFSAPSAVAQLSDDVLFGPDTIPLDASQRNVVRALLSRRSVLYSTALPGQEALVLDVGLRAREWKQTVVYCAPTQRAAEALFATLAAHLGAKVSIALDVGYVSCVYAAKTDMVTAAVVDSGGGAVGEGGQQRPCVVVTVGQVLRRAVVDMEACWWMREADVFFLDNILMPETPEWEEVLLGMPTRALLCIIASDINDYDRDELPLWLELVQNSVVPIAPLGCARFWDRVDRPTGVPPIRAFVYNASSHKHPIQVSFPLLERELLKDLERNDFPWPSAGKHSSPTETNSRKSGLRSGSRKARGRRAISAAGLVDTADYASAMLKGVQALPADEVKNLSFEHPSHSQYGDIVAMILGDVRQTCSRAKSKQAKKPSTDKTGKKTMRAVCAAAGRRRRRVESELLPAIVLVHGRRECENAAGAIQAGLSGEDLDLVIDTDASNLLVFVLDEFLGNHKGQLSLDDEKLVDGLNRGVGVVHEGVLPALRMLAEDLFRDGLAPILVVDSFLGPRELSALPRGRSVLASGSVLAEQSDSLHGLVKGTLAGSLAGRPGLDDVGNLVCVWFDENLSDEEASRDLAFSLWWAAAQSRFSPASSSLVGYTFERGFEQSSRSFSSGTAYRSSRYSADALLNARHPTTIVQSVGLSSTSKRRSGAFLATFRGQLSALRRHAVQGYNHITDYTLDSYRGWLVGAALRATREKLELEQQALDIAIKDTQWDEMALYDRLEARLSEQMRVYDTMASRKRKVLSENMFTELRSRDPGTLIGLRVPESAVGLLTEEENLAVPDSGSNGAEGGAGKTEKPGTRVKGGKARVGNDGQDQVASGVIVSTRNFAHQQEKTSMIPASFIAVYDNSQSQVSSAAVKAWALVVCITCDGMWTMVPVDDVLAVDDDIEVIPNVDLIPVPHLATFDLDPATTWAKCKPFSDSEAARVLSVSDLLIAELASQDSRLSRLKPMTIVELDKQATRVLSARQLVIKSPWHGREAEMAELRRLRRRSVQLVDELNILCGSERRLETGVHCAREEFLNRLKAQLAVLEDCNAVTVISKDNMEMTPIGAVASMLPSPYPLFAAACLLLVSRLDELSPGEFAAFMTVLYEVPESDLGPSAQSSSDEDGPSPLPQSLLNDLRFEIPNSEDDENMDAFDGRESRWEEGGINPPRRLTGVSREVDELEGVLPIYIMQDMDEIRRALRTVHIRHFNTPLLLAAPPRVVPRHLSTRFARAVHHFVEGEWTWNMVVERTDAEVGDIVGMFRMVTEGLSLVEREEYSLGELSDLRSIAARARSKLLVWPTVDLDDAMTAAREGVGVRLLAVTNRNSTYRSWWSRAKAQVNEVIAQAEETVQRAEAEVVEEEMEEADGDVEGVTEKADTK